MAVVEWLPAAALADIRVEQKLREAMNPWSKRWFPLGQEYQLAKLAVAKVGGAPKATIGEPREIGGGFAYNHIDAQIVALGLCIVDAPVGAEACNHDDVKLLSSLADEALRDLAAAFAKSLALGTSDEAVVDYGSAVSLFCQGNDNAMPEIKLLLPTQHLVAFRKSLIATAEDIPPDGAKISEALGDEMLRIEARLGEAALSVGELAGLGVGDVIILDTGIEDFFPLVSAKSGQRLCDASLSQSQGQLQVIASNG